jgi:protein-serine/threonine kinase
VSTAFLILSPRHGTDFFVAHNDIKPSNIMLSCTNTPIFVDFGFAQKWDVNAVDTGANTLIGGLTTLTGYNASCHELFQSEISWGTPEYLDPQRAKGLKHDERASDVWALGVSLTSPSARLWRLTHVRDFR